MGLIQDHSKTVDGRGKLDRMRLGELQNLLNEKGVQYDRSWGAIVLREVVKKAGINDYNPPPRPLGAIGQMPVTPTSHKFRDGPQPSAQQNVIEVDALADIIRQQVQAQMVRTVEQMNITELRKACKAKGIKISRTDNMVALKAKLNGENPAPIGQ